MLSFSAPLWLIALAPLAVLGALALRRERSARVAVPTLRFWQGAANQSASRKQSNWRWLPLAMAAPAK